MTLSTFPVQGLYSVSFDSSLLLQLSKHLDESCNEYEMVCPMKETIGCQFKVYKARQNKLLVSQAIIPSK